MYIFSEFFNDWCEEKWIFFSSVENQNIYIKKVFLFPFCNHKEVTTTICYDGSKRLFCIFLSKMNCLPECRIKKYNVKKTECEKFHSNLLFIMKKYLLLVH